MSKRTLSAAARGLPRASPRIVVDTAILQLIDLLDELDGDCDLEDDDREEDKSDFEPSLGSVWSNHEYWAQGSPWALDAELDDSDDEPSLAAPIGAGDQSNWARGGDCDLEETFVFDDRPLPGPSYRRQCAAERRALEREIAVLAARIRRRARSVTRRQGGRDAKA